METPKLFKIRAATDADMPFIFNSWLKSYRDSPTVKNVPNSLYYSCHHAVIEKLLAHPKLILAVAHNPDDVTQIYGYAVATLESDYMPMAITALHWVYVKHPFRGFGIGKTLEASVCGTEPSQVHYTHRVKMTERLLGTRPYTYNPYLLHARA